MAILLQKPISIFKTLIDIMLPPVCYVCGRSCSGKYGLCEGCLGKIKHITPPYCSICGRRLATRESVCSECNAKPSHIERGWSCCYYQDTMKECIHLFKYRGYIGLTDIFKDIMIDFIKKNEILKSVDLIIAVPAHPAKKRQRRYNHAEVLALSLSKIFAFPVDIKNLRKIRWTESQSELDRKKRLKNVKDAFLAVDKNAFSGRNLLLIDDVYTTGATINECARVLREAKANRVFSLTLARGL